VSASRRGPAHGLCWPRPRAHGPAHSLLFIFAHSAQGIAHPCPEFMFFSVLALAPPATAQTSNRTLVAPAHSPAHCFQFTFAPPPGQWPCPSFRVSLLAPPSSHRHSNLIAPPTGGAQASDSAHPAP
jgi:hypothetical protein